MNQSLSEVTSGIEALSEFNERALDEMSEKYSEMLDAQERVVDSNRQINDNITKTGQDISDAFNTSSKINAKGYEDIRKAINDAGEKSYIGSVVAGYMINSALVGIGAVLQYRERMEQLRHIERMSFNEENSDAGKARRELKTASSILFAGDPTQALSHLTNSLKLFPSSAETFRLRSVIESRQENHKAAIISLKTSLKLAEDNNLYPTIQNLDGSITDELYEKVITSSLTQLSQELALTGQFNDAISYLSNGIELFNKNSDLYFQRIRILSKTSLWDSLFEKYISDLVKISPKHFNILYSDFQLNKKKEQIQSYLKSIRSEFETQIQNKKKTLIVLTDGNSIELEKLKKTQIDQLSFVSIVSLSANLTKSIKEQVYK